MAAGRVVIPKAPDTRWRRYIAGGAVGIVALGVVFVGLEAFRDHFAASSHGATATQGTADMVRRPSARLTIPISAVVPPSVAAPSSDRPVVTVADPGPTPPPAPPNDAADAPAADKPQDGPPAAVEPDKRTVAAPPSPPQTLLAANGLPLPPPVKPAIPNRCPPLDPVRLAEQTPAGRLPRIDANGCMPWLAYASPFNYRETRPRIGIVLLGLGRDPQLTQRAIDSLPPHISLGFAADAPMLDRWIERAQARGHEALVMLPVQSPNRLADTTMAPLRADVTPAENVRRLQAVLARAGTGYIGVVVPMATPFSASETVLRPVLKDISDRGLLLLETFRTHRKIYEIGTGLGLPYSADAGWIDRKPDGAEITANLQALEEFTQRNHFALAVGTAQRETIERLIAWSKDVETRGLALTPVTGLTECLGLCAERVRKALAGGAR